MMRYFLTAFLSVVAFATVTPALSQPCVWIEDYYQYDGTLVPGHYRTVPDGEIINNLSEEGECDMQFDGKAVGDSIQNIFKGLSGPTLQDQIGIERNVLELELGRARLNNAQNKRNWALQDMMIDWRMRQALQPYQDTKEGIEAQQKADLEQALAVADRDAQGNLAVARENNAGNLAVSDRDAQGNLAVARENNAGNLAVSDRDAQGNLAVARENNAGNLAVADRDAQGNLAVARENNAGNLAVADRDAQGNLAVARENNAGNLAVADRDAQGNLAVARENNAGTLAVANIGKTPDIQRQGEMDQKQAILDAQLEANPNAYSFQELPGQINQFVEDITGTDASPELTTTIFAEIYRRMRGPGGNILSATQSVFGDLSQILSRNRNNFIVKDTPGFLPGDHLVYNGDLGQLFVAPQSTQPQPVHIVPPPLPTQDMWEAVAENGFQATIYLNKETGQEFEFDGKTIRLLD